MNRTLVEGGAAESAIILTDLSMPEGGLQTLVQVVIGIATLVRFFRERKKAKKEQQ